MWEQLRNEVIDRFTSVEAYFKATGRFRGESLTQASKGWAFVHIYSAYEFTVTASMRTAIDAVVAHQHTILELEPRLMALFLDSYLISVKECDPQDTWTRRTVLLSQLFKSGPAFVRNTIFPKSHKKEGKQFRPQQLQLIFDIFGVPRTPIRMARHLHRIVEIVETRNLIAHGEETADDVGRRFSRAEISKRISQVRTVCLQFIQALETHCSDPQLQKRSTASAAEGGP